MSREQRCNQSAQAFSKLLRPVLSGMVMALALLCCLGQVGCTSGDTVESGSSDAADGSTKQTLVVGMELAYPPFETRDEAGDPYGISPAFMEAFAETYGYDLQIENIAFDGLIPALQTGKADAIMSSITITEEREEEVDFTDPYAVAQLAILANSESNISSIDDSDE